MKNEIEKQIAIYTIRLKNLKDNRAKLTDLMTDEENSSFDEQVRMIADFIRVLKKLEMSYKLNHN